MRIWVNGIQISINLFCEVDLELRILVDDASTRRLLLSDVVIGVLFGRMMHTLVEIQIDVFLMS